VEKGKFYLFSSPFFWTFVGRFMRRVDMYDIEANDVIYFTRTGATFDILCKSGLIMSGDRKSLYHYCGDGILIPAQGPKFPWHAKTPWAKKEKL
jgi:hypothetical protein